MRASIEARIPPCHLSRLLVITAASHSSAQPRRARKMPCGLLEQSGRRACTNFGFVVVVEGWVEGQSQWLVAFRCRAPWVCLKASSVGRPRRARLGSTLILFQGLRSCWLLVMVMVEVGNLATSLKTGLRPTWPSCLTIPQQRLLMGQPSTSGLAGRF